MKIFNKTNGLLIAAGLFNYWIGIEDVLVPYFIASPPPNNTIFPIVFCLLDILCLCAAKTLWNWQKASGGNAWFFILFMLSCLFYASSFIMTGILRILS